MLDGVMGHSFGRCGDSKPEWAYQAIVVNEVHAQSRWFLRDYGFDSRRLHLRFAIKTIFWHQRVCNDYVLVHKGLTDHKGQPIFHLELRGIHVGEMQRNGRIGRRTYRTSKAATAAMKTLPQRLHCVREVVAVPDDFKPRHTHAPAPAEWSN